MKLFGMAEGFRTQLESAACSGLSFEERFALLVDEQWTSRQNRALARRLRAAKLKERRVIEDVSYQHPRQLDQADPILGEQRLGTPAPQHPARNSPLISFPCLGFAFPAVGKRTLTTR